MGVIDIRLEFGCGNDHFLLFQDVPERGSKEKKNRILIVRK